MKWRNSSWWQLAVARHSLWFIWSNVIDSLTQWTLLHCGDTEVRLAVCRCTSRKSWISNSSCVQCEGLGCSSSLLITHHITFPWIRSANTVFWQIRSGSLIGFAEGFCRVKCYTQDQIIFYSFIKLNHAAWSLQTLPWQFWVLHYSTFFCIGQWFLLLPDLVPVWPVMPVKI